LDVDERMNVHFRTYPQILEEGRVSQSTAGSDVEPGILEGELPLAREKPADIYDRRTEESCYL
jgi:hypothetical protein